MVWKVFEDMVGGEIYVKKILFMVIRDIVDVVCSGVI